MMDFCYHWSEILSVAAEEKERIRLSASILMRSQVLYLAAQVAA